MDKQAGLQEGASPAIGLYPQTVDNPVNKVGNSEVIWEKTSGSAQAIINQGVLYCLSAGDLAIRAIYQGKTYQTHLQVAENTSLGRAVSVRPLRLYTAKGTYHSCHLQSWWTMSPVVQNESRLFGRQSPKKI